MARQHDAELCERIRVLEERVKALEDRPQTTWVPSFTHYCYPGCPQHYGTGHPWVTPTWWTNTTITYGSDTTSDTDGYITVND